MGILQTFDGGKSHSLVIQDIDGMIVDRLHNLYRTDVRIRPTRLVSLALLSIFEHSDLTVNALNDLVVKRASGYALTLYNMRRQGLLRIKGSIKDENTGRTEQINALDQAGAEILADVRHNMGTGHEAAPSLNHRVMLHDTLRDEAGLFGVPSIGILMMLEQGVTNASELARWANVPLSHITRLTHSCRVRGLMQPSVPLAEGRLTLKGQRLIDLMRTL